MAVIRDLFLERWNLGPISLEILLESMILRHVGNVLSKNECARIARIRFKRLHDATLGGLYPSKAEASCFLLSVKADSPFSYKSTNGCSQRPGGLNEPNYVSRRT